jgi:small subunit ribosomal protein S3
MGFRIGVIYDWQSKWYADKHYTGLLHEDLKIRRLIMTSLWDAGISKVEIDRNANQAVVTVHTAKPGIVIGRGGQKVDELRANLEKATGRRVRVNISEIRQPQRRVAFRRAMKQAVSRTMQRGAKGIKIIVGGRLGGTEMSRRETEKDGRVPLHTLRADIDYGLAEAHTTFGRIGVKVWIYKGDILPEPKAPPAPAEEAVVVAPTTEAAEAPPVTAAPPESAEAAPAAEEAAPAAAAEEAAPATAETAPESAEAAPAEEAVASDQAVPPAVSDKKPEKKPRAKPKEKPKEKPED